MRRIRAVTVRSLEHVLLSTSLAGAVHTLRIRCVQRLIRVALRAIENEVGGDVKDPSTVPDRGSADVSGALGIDLEGEVALLLGAIYRGVSRRR